MRNLVPTACVVVPTFRRPELLERCLRSLQEQSQQAHEIKIVASDPAEKETIERMVDLLGLTQADVIAKTRLLLGGEARNVGWRSCCSDIVMFVDDDDYWDSEKIAKHTRKHVESAAEVVYSGVVYTFGSSEQDFVRLARPPASDMRTALLRDGFCPPTTSCVSVTRSALEGASGFDEALKSYQDWDLWYRLAGTCNFASISEPLVYFVQHRGERVSMQSSNRLQAAKQLLEKYGRSQQLLEFLNRELVRTLERALVFSAREGDGTSFPRFWSEVRAGNLKVVHWRTYWISLKMLVYWSNHLFARALKAAR
ncbi:glycosyltransferase [Bradyrhizobium sp. NBAIM08]|uniref:glycosyltransferase family 2 protein n=1 Tax=Bradyrhizobium sp. NBAIM08 TaxID=2793815 RepID=UPI001CD42657|nr:glycosyltransferase [Bradyrhizobium sp. NBAIM08]MCA1476126.1 glycosyltransferase [Bradyrhizobium sp. NBAIM08]